MEPITNIPKPDTPDSDSGVYAEVPKDMAREDRTVQNPNGEISLSMNQAPMEQQRSQDEDTNEQIIERLKEQRDELRGLSTLEASEKPKTHKIRSLLIILLTVLATSGTYLLLIKPALDKPNTPPEQSTQKTFVLPSDLSSKTSEEKNALNIIALARKNETDTIISTYLNKAQLGQSEADFKALVTSYGSSADGESVELIEKKVGKVDFASTGESSAIAETTSEFEAASLVYKSGYFRHTNNIYLKVNLYKPDPTADLWKMYIFEFKAGENESPLKADTHVPI